MITDEKKENSSKSFKDTFIIEKAYSNDTYLLTIVEGDRVIARTSMS